MTTPDQTPPIRLLTRANENRCQHCPPERICAWACVQGAGFEDIVIGAMLERGDSWALRYAQPDAHAAQQAMWELYNK